MVWFKPAATRSWRTVFAVYLSFSMIFSPLPVLAGTGEGLVLPAPGKMVSLSPAFSPVVLKGVKLDPKDPFRFQFYVDTSSLRGSDSDRSNLKPEAQRLIKYFLASLTVPEQDLWVNLSPYEKDRIIPQEFGLTEMGRDLLAQDYLLKQITASLIYPESQLGKEFWQKVYAQAQEKYGTTDIPVNTFNKVWIMPEKAVVYENNSIPLSGEGKGGGQVVAYVLENHLKVMLEQDYLALQKHSPTWGHPPEGGVSPSRLPTSEGLGVKATQGINGPLDNALKPDNGNPKTQASQLASKIVKDLIIPALTKEVNEGQNFAPLRQVFYSLILATWYKKKIKDSILNKVYSDKSKIVGVDYDYSVILRPEGAKDPKVNNKPLDPSVAALPQDDAQAIYQEYLQAFKKGVFNYIKEEPPVILSEAKDLNRSKDSSALGSGPQNDRVTTPRKYFSGGVAAQRIAPTIQYVTPAMISPKDAAALSKTQVVEVDGNVLLDHAADNAMNAPSAEDSQRQERVEIAMRTLSHGGWNNFDQSVHDYWLAIKFYKHRSPGAMPSAFQDDEEERLFKEFSDSFMLNNYEEAFKKFKKWREFLIQFSPVFDNVPDAYYEERMAKVQRGVTGAQMRDLQEHIRTRLFDLMDDLISFGEGDINARTQTLTIDQGFIQEVRKFSEFKATANVEFFIRQSGECRGDRRKILNIFRNLATNTFKIAKERGIQGPKADVSVSQKDGQTVIEYLDNAGGFTTPEGLALLLPSGEGSDRQRAFLLGETQREKGTGVGLADVYYLAKLHNGKVIVENVTDAQGQIIGAKFTITLPADEVMNAQLSESVEQAVHVKLKTGKFVSKKIYERVYGALQRYRAWRNFNDQSGPLLRALSFIKLNFSGDSGEKRLNPDFDKLMAYGADLNYALPIWQEDGLVAIEGDPTVDGIRSIEVPEEIGKVIQASLYAPNTVDGSYVVNVQDPKADRAMMTSDAELLTLLPNFRHDLNHRLGDLIDLWQIMKEKGKRPETVLIGDFITTYMHYDKATREAYQNPPLQLERFKMLLERMPPIIERLEASLGKDLIEVKRILADISDYIRSIKDNRMNIKSVPLQKTIEDLIRGDFYEGKFIRETQFDPLAETIKADRVRLVRALDNLLSNAKEAMPDGGTIKVTTRFLKKEKKVEVVISDTGKGMSPQQVVYFNQHGRLSSTKGEEGHGLGVGIAKQFIEQLGGTLTLESTLGQGATFTITLPADQAMTVQPPVDEVMEAKSPADGAMKSVPKNEGSHQARKPWEATGGLFTFEQLKTIVPKRFNDMRAVSPFRLVASVNALSPDQKGKLVALVFPGDGWLRTVMQMHGVVPYFPAMELWEELHDFPLKSPRTNNVEYRKKLEEEGDVQYKMLKVAHQFKLKAHGTGGFYPDIYRSGLQDEWALLSIVMAGRLSYGDIGTLGNSLTGRFDPFQDAEGYGPYYVIMKRDAKTVFDQDIYKKLKFKFVGSTAHLTPYQYMPASEHLMYLVPSEADRSFMVKGLSLAVKYGFLEQKEVKAKLDQLLTYADFISIASYMQYVIDGRLSLQGALEKAKSGDSAQLSQSAPTADGAMKAGDARLTEEEIEVRVKDYVFDEKLSGAPTLWEVYGVRGHPEMPVVKVLNRNYWDLPTVRSLESNVRTALYTMGRMVFPFVALHNMTIQIKEKKGGVKRATAPIVLVQERIYKTPVHGQEYSRKVEQLMTELNIRGIDIHDHLGISNVGYTKTGELLIADFGTPTTDNDTISMPVPLPVVPIFGRSKNRARAVNKPRSRSADGAKNDGEVAQAGVRQATSSQDKEPEILRVGTERISPLGYNIRNGEILVRKTRKLGLYVPYPENKQDPVGKVDFDQFEEDFRKYVVPEENLTFYEGGSLKMGEFGQSRTTSSRVTYWLISSFPIPKNKKEVTLVDLGSAQGLFVLRSAHALGLMYPNIKFHLVGLEGDEGYFNKSIELLQLARSHDFIPSNVDVRFIKGDYRETGPPILQIADLVYYSDAGFFADHDGQSHDTAPYAAKLLMKYLRPGASVVEFGSQNLEEELDKLWVLFSEQRVFDEIQSSAKKYLFQIYHFQGGADEGMTVETGIEDSAQLSTVHQGQAQKPGQSLRADGAMKAEPIYIEDVRNERESVSREIWWAFFEQLVAQAQYPREYTSGRQSVQWRYFPGDEDMTSTLNKLLEYLKGHVKGVRAGVGTGLVLDWPGSPFDQEENEQMQELLLYWVVSAVPLSDLRMLSLIFQIRQILTGVEENRKFLKEERYYLDFVNYASSRGGIGIHFLGQDQEDWPIAKEIAALKALEKIYKISVQVDSSDKIIISPNNKDKWEMVDPQDETKDKEFIFQWLMLQCRLRAAARSFFVYPPIERLWLGRDPDSQKGVEKVSEIRKIILDFTAQRWALLTSQSWEGFREALLKTKHEFDGLKFSEPTNSQMHEDFNKGWAVLTRSFNVFKPSGLAPLDAAMTGEELVQAIKDSPTMRNYLKRDDPEMKDVLDKFLSMPEVVQKFEERWNKLPLDFLTDARYATLSGGFESYTLREFYLFPTKGFTDMSQYLTPLLNMVGSYAILKENQDVLKRSVDLLLAAYLMSKKDDLFIAKDLDDDSPMIRIWFDEHVGFASWLSPPGEAQRPVAEDVSYAFNRYLSFSDLLLERLTNKGSDSKSVEIKEEDLVEGMRVNLELKDSVRYFLALGDKIEQRYDQWQKERQRPVIESIKKDPHYQEQVDLLREALEKADAITRDSAQLSPVHQGQAPEPGQSQGADGTMTSKAPADGAMTIDEQKNQWRDLLQNYDQIRLAVRGLAGWFGNVETQFPALLAANHNLGIEQLIRSQSALDYFASKGSEGRSITEWNSLKNDLEGLRVVTRYYSEHFHSLRRSVELTIKKGSGSDVISSKRYYFVVFLKVILDNPALKDEFLLKMAKVSNAVETLWPEIKKTFDGQKPDNVEKLADKAMRTDVVTPQVNKKGGIDLNPAQMSLEVKKSGMDSRLRGNDSGIEIDAAQVTGARFFIQSIKPVSDLPKTLGIAVQVE